MMRGQTGLGQMDMKKIRGVRESEFSFHQIHGERVWCEDNLPIRKVLNSMSLSALLFSDGLKTQSKTSAFLPATGST